MLCIRIRKDPHHFDNLNPLQIKIRIRIKLYKLGPNPEPDPHQFVDVKPKCMELALFHGFGPFFEVRIWIRISVKSRIRIRIKVVRILNIVCTVCTVYFRLGNRDSCPNLFVPDPGPYLPVPLQTVK